jgi:hypothetical protein
MAIVRINPKSKDYALLQAGGKYGPGAEHSAEVVCREFKGQVDPGDGPGYDPQCDRNQYCKFVFAVDSVEYGQVFVRDWQPLEANSGSRALEYLVNLGVPVDDEGNFDDEYVVGSKCVLEVGDPVESKKTPGRWFTGNVKGVYGL